MKTYFYLLQFSFLLFCLSTTIKTEASGSLPRISVEGNRFVTPDGETIIFQGVNFADPDRLVKEGQWKKDLFRVARDWGSNIVRLPVHPQAWRERGKEDYLLLIDQAVEWAREFDLYIIIDWHSIGNLRTELFQHEMYKTSLPETFDFWLTISRRYADEPIIAMYEIFNEPTTYQGQLGSLTWDQWTEILTDIIYVIRANSPEAIPLVAGFNWAYDLTPLMYAPLNIPGIAYVSHPYPQKRDQPWIPQWERDFGFAADDYPIIATEIGFMQPTDRGAHVPCIGDEEYGRTLMRYFRDKGISWVAWCFDPDWSPQLIKDWNYTPTRSGRFFRDVMLGKEKLDE
ncbi:glycoside hydrolase family 5 protein [Natronoflexus pectinivorans]|uniref:Cellulase (Glycosyl hydrolase family 5) n=1 Tax=Natronoflexus pectinivorans TaxID=682526 RepID=A0A4R2GPR2_9BACT|nr:cellulase family glycosylhydrolase [Natronoflexus pectinivorans]TCO11048.1 cellulase (glycosyl hydrolase family 5) [Natronoflexus pectinivorans]